MTKKRNCGIAIDIGTTTVAMSFHILEENRKKEIETISFLNPQRAMGFGSDVLSRLKLSSNPQIASRLRKVILLGIAEGKERLILSALEKGEDSRVAALVLENLLDEEMAGMKCTIAANTAMVHLLCGLPTKGLLAAPFEPADISLRKEKICEMDATIFPGVGAFVGGDIIAGIYALGLNEKKENGLFVDLGTNGELVLARKGELFAASVAAGPAFEGGNVSIGTAAVEGAVSAVHITNGFCRVETIGGEAVSFGNTAGKGRTLVCGSGFLSLLAELYRSDCINRHGTLAEAYFDEGYPVCIGDADHRLMLKQDDIRALQTAKAAVAAGIESLLEAAAITAEDVDRVYIAGSFGEYIHLEDAYTIGLLPQAFQGKTKTVGNSSLEGAKKLLTHPEDEQQLSDVVSKINLVSLADDAGFKEAYIRNMDLPE